MAEIRTTVPDEELAVLDAYIQAGGAPDRTVVMRKLLSEWAEQQVHVAIKVLRSQQINPLLRDSDRLTNTEGKPDRKGGDNP